MIDASKLKLCMPAAKMENIVKYIDYILITAVENSIDTTARLAAFIAQVGHESGNFARIEENLNYSTEGLLATFKSRFTPETALQYARNPEKIANYVYGNRLGNGSEASGDGWKYRGRGLIQITGKSNYYECGKGLSVDLVSDPTLLLNPEFACRSAGWYWNRTNLNLIADRGDIKEITKKINGGYIGLQDRVDRYNLALNSL